jgi:hypothetical protein
LPLAEFTIPGYLLAEFTRRDLPAPLSVVKSASAVMEADNSRLGDQWQLALALITSVLGQALDSAQGVPGTGDFLSQSRAKALTLRLG